MNLSLEKAYVTYNPSMVGLEDMKKAVEDAGYQFLGLAGEEAQADTEKREQEKDLGQEAAHHHRLCHQLLPHGSDVPASGSESFPWMSSWPSPIYESFMLVVSAPVFVYVSLPIFAAALRALRNRNLDMDVMYAMGIGVAYCSSILGTFGIVLTPDFMFYETAVMLASFLTLGRYLEAGAKGSTSEAIKKLVGLQPRTATVQREGEVEVAVEEVEVERYNRGQAWGEDSCGRGGYRGPKLCG